MNYEMERPTHGYYVYSCNLLDTNDRNVSSAKAPHGAETICGAYPYA